MRAAALALAFASSALAQSLTEVLSSNPDLSNLTQLINSSQNADTLSQLSNITLLAPNNAAISEFLASPAAANFASSPSLVSAVLSYHVIQGNYSNITNTSFLRTALTDRQYSLVSGGQRVEAVANDGNVTFFSGLLQNSSVVNASIPFTGGTIHIIDRLLTVPQNVSTTAVALNLTSVAGALGTLNLTETVDTTEDLTFFLPNNAAFQRIGGSLANLSTDNLTEILSYHVVPGLYYSTNITNGSSVQTLQMNNITLRIEGGSVYANGAKVIQPNVLVQNGVVHVIDSVLNPNNATQVPNTSTTEEAFAGATSASDEPFTSGVPTPTSSIATSAVQSAQGSSTSSAGAFRPLETGAVAMAALFGGAVAALNM